MSDQDLTMAAKALGYEPVLNSEGQLVCFQSAEGHAVSKDAIDYASSHPEYAAKIHASKQTKPQPKTERAAK